MKISIKHIILFAVTGVILNACGGDSDSSSPGTAKKGSVATITFDNGEVLSASVICVLKPQMAAGQEILYTATSTSSPYFDVTMFGPSSIFAGGKVSWDDTRDFEQYKAQWASIPAVVGGSFAVSLAGTTITGSGTLVRGKDEAGREGEKRKASITVNCDG